MEGDTVAAHAESANCGQCGIVLLPEAAFCTSCGAPARANAPNLNGWRDTKRFLWSFGLIAFYIAGSHIIDGWTDYRALLAWDFAFFLLVVGVAVHFNRAMGGALRPRRISGERVLIYLFAQVVLTCLVVVTMPWLNRAFGLEEVSYTALFRSSPWPLLLSILSTAVFPAITEELAFRGLLFGQLRQLTGDVPAIIVQGILFATLHFAMLSMYWLLPAGLLYGWIRHREGHIWCGVLLHLTHNGLVVLMEF